MSQTHVRFAVTVLFLKVFGDGFGRCTNVSTLGIRDPRLLSLAYIVQVFACTVGQKPSKAPFYFNDTADVASLLARLSKMHSRPKLAPSGKGMRRV